MIEELITDPTFRQLLKPHLDNAQFLSLELGKLVKEYSPDDDFSVAQYLLGLEYYKKRLHAIFPPGQLFLDVGCGAGNWSLSAASFFQQVVGVDLREDRLKVATRMASSIKCSNVRFESASALRLPLDSGVVDALLCYNVLQFIDHPHRLVLSEMRRVMKPGGLAYFWVPDIGIILYYLRQTFGSRSVAQWRNMSRILGRAFLSLFGFRPISWMNQNYMLNICQRSGWDVKGVGSECSIGNLDLKPIFPPEYARFPFGREYLLSPRS